MKNKQSSSEHRMKLIIRAARCAAQPPKRLNTHTKNPQTHCTITCLCSSHTPSAPPEGSSPAPPAGRRRRCLAALWGSPCGPRLHSAPPARPRSLMRKQRAAESRRWRPGRQRGGFMHMWRTATSPKRSGREEGRHVYRLIMWW